MAVFFTTLFSALGSGGGAAAGAGAAGAASSGIGLTSIFSAASTVVGGLASIAAGNQQAAALEAQAQQDELQANQDELAGRQEAVNAFKRMNEEMGAGLVASYASGLQSSGSTAVALDEARKTGERNAEMSRSQSAASAAARRQSAAQRRSDADGARAGGIFGAISGGLSYAGRNYQRG